MYFFFFMNRNNRWGILFNIRLRNSFQISLIMMNKKIFFEQSTPVNQNRFDLFGNTTASSLFETTILHKTESMTGLDKFNRNNIQTTSTVCKMKRFFSN